MSDINSEISMTTAVLNQLREDINNNTYASGQFITEKEISEKFNVSKTPAREALNLLCQDGILEKFPRRGYVIKTFSYHELQNLCQLRSVLECGAIKYAVRYASDDELNELDKLAHWKIDASDPDFNRQYNKNNYKFHLSIAQLTKNPYLISALQNVLLKIRDELAVDGKAHIEEALGIHILIVDAMKKRDADLACNINADNIEMAGKRLYSK